MFRKFEGRKKEECQENHVPTNLGHGDPPRMIDELYFISIIIVFSFGGMAKTGG